MSARTRTGKAAKRGRPSKGDRRSFMCRVPRELGNVVMESADEAGLTYSDWIAHAIADKAQYTLPPGFTTRPTASDHSVQEEIPMQNAS